MYWIAFDKEEDGRWIAEIPAVPGCLVYGETLADAERKVIELADRVEAERAIELDRQRKILQEIEVKHASILKGLADR